MSEMETKRRTPEIEIIEDDSFDFDGYQVVRGEFFSHIYEPSFTLNQNKVSVNMACIRKLPDVEYVQALVNPVTKKLAIRPCSEDVKDSFRWCSSGKKLAPKQITCRIFFGKVFALMDWNPNHRYKLLGKLIRSNGELLFSFDLNNPEIYERKVKEDGKQSTSRTPVYPEDWKNQFGLPVEEHQRNLQVNIFDGYTVFGIQEKKGKAAPESGNVESEVTTNEHSEDAATDPMY